MYFGVRLSDVWAGLESVNDVADYAANLPRGGAVGEWFGGRLAVTSEVESLWELSHIVAQVNSEKKLKSREMPEGLRDGVRKREVALDKAKRYKARVR